ncbi:diguanylate cyclase [Rhizobium sp. SSA_523]|uniref:sensor domain-containing diguanylate cyclase n=1 Tax=Rhizobium sp. SSA_523 TaxID=2952477 RepID=UPI0020909AC1|nr:diguanylate cyclase [Rhizobium sp. SSA_523]MCO5730213.1 diguanylate cyclase [Rhizobium sp. SSA_523]WKC25273.1 diguanylate cyclase [Rhizobium sp. SSA_523]
MKTDSSSPFHILILLLGAVAVAACIVFWGEMNSRATYLASINQSLDQASVALGQNISDSIDLADLALLGIEARLGDLSDPAAVRAALALIFSRYSRNENDLRNLHVISADGHLIATTVQDADMGARFADRGYFRHHASDPSDTLYLGAPIVSRVSGEQIVTVTRRLNAPDGRFTGVLVAHLSIQRFNLFLERYLRSFGDADALFVRHDGTVLGSTSAFVSMIGKTMPPDTLKSLTAHADRQEGEAEPITWPMDGIQRQTAVFMSDRPAFSIIIGSPRAGILAQWMRLASPRWLASVGLLVAGILLSIRWYRQARLHHDSRKMLLMRDQELQHLANASGDLIERLSLDGVREYVSAASTQILGRPPEQLIGTRIFDDLPPEDRGGAIEKFEAFLKERTTRRITVRYIDPGGRQAWLETLLSPVEAQGELTGIVAVTRDVTRHKLHQDRLDELANTDTLTGLANRRAFNRELEQRLDIARASGRPLSLLVTDVDRFKRFNDAYGHANGDEALRQVAGAIRDAVRSSDLVARFGGEEFAVILDNAAPEIAAMVADKIRLHVADLRLTHERNLPWGHLTISIGTASLWPPHLPDDASEGAKALFEAADRALYRAKRGGRNRCVSSDSPLSGPLDQAPLGAKLGGSRGASLVR